MNVYSSYDDGIPLIPVTRSSSSMTPQSEEQDSTFEVSSEVAETSEADDLENAIDSLTALAEKMSASASSESSSLTDEKIEKAFTKAMKALTEETMTRKTDISLTAQLLKTDSDGLTVLGTFSELVHLSEIPSELGRIRDNLHEIQLLNNELQQHEERRLNVLASGNVSQAEITDLEKAIDKLEGKIKRLDSLRLMQMRLVSEKIGNILHASGEATTGTGVTVIESAIRKYEQLEKARELASKGATPTDVIPSDISHEAIEHVVESPPASPHHEVIEHVVESPPASPHDEVIEHTVESPSTAPHHDDVTSSASHHEGTTSHSGSHHLDLEKLEHSLFISSVAQSCAASLEIINSVYKVVNLATNFRQAHNEIGEVKRELKELRATGHSEDKAKDLEARLEALKEEQHELTDEFISVGLEGARAAGITASYIGRSVKIALPSLQTAAVASAVAGSFGGIACIAITAKALDDNRKTHSKLSEAKAEVLTTLQSLDPNTQVELIQICNMKLASIKRQIRDNNIGIFRNIVSTASCVLGTTSSGLTAAMAAGAVVGGGALAASALASGGISLAVIAAAVGIGYFTYTHRTEISHEFKTDRNYARQVILDVQIDRLRKEMDRALLGSDESQVRKLEQSKLSTEKTADELEQIAEESKAKLGIVRQKLSVVDEKVNEVKLGLKKGSLSKSEKMKLAKEEHDLKLAHKELERESKILKKNSSSEVQRRIRDLRGKSQDISKQIAHIQNKNIPLRDRLKDGEEKLSALNIAMDKLKKEITILESEIESHELDLLPSDDPDKVEKMMEAERDRKARLDKRTTKLEEFTARSQQLQKELAPIYKQLKIETNSDRIHTLALRIRKLESKKDERVEESLKLKDERIDHTLASALKEVNPVEVKSFRQDISRALETANGQAEIVEFLTKKGIIMTRRPATMQDVINYISRKI